MKIEQADVALSACHNFSSECTFRVETESSFRAVFADVSQAAPSALTASTAPPRPVDSSEKSLLLLETLIARMLDFILGHRTAQASDIREVLRTDAPARASGEPVRLRREVSMTWSSKTIESVREQERSDFSSIGKVRTADGRTLDFRLDLTLSRDYQAQRTSIRQEQVVLRDPLVINFSGAAAAFSERCFAFDLDVDGQTENLRTLAPGCGFLTLDMNADGRVNDGSELFGARSGDGFADLARLDSDGNDWIDEADPAFNALRIWQFDATGQASLSTLREQGVGALYLGAIETPFSLTDDENRMLAQIRASGVYLREDGGAGALQQIDLAL